MPDWEDRDYIGTGGYILAVITFSPIWIPVVCFLALCYGIGWIGKSLGMSKPNHDDWDNF